MVDDGSSQAFWIVSDRALFSSGERAAALLVDGNRIRQVEAADAVRKGGQRKVFDVGSDPLVPGWVNAHTHLAMSPLRGITSWGARRGNVVTDVFFRIESHLTPADVYAFSCLGAYESALSGGLFVCDHYYFGGAIARALLDVGLGGVVGATLQDRAGPFAPKWEAQLDETLGQVGDARLFQAGIFPALAPHAADTVSSRLMARIGELARQLQVPVHMHLAQSYEEVRTLARDRPSIGPELERVFDQLDGCSVLIAHGLHLGREAIQRCVSRDWVLAYCPLSQLQFGFLGPAACWLELGGRLALGTDCVASNDALDVQRELPVLAGDAALRASFSPQRSQLLSLGRAEDSLNVERARKEQLSRLDTSDPDLLLRAADGRPFASLGTWPVAAPFEVGSLANILVLDSEHPSLFAAQDLKRALAYGSTQGAIKWGVVGGRIVGRKRGWRNEWIDTDDYREVRKEALRRRVELLERAGFD